MFFDLLGHPGMGPMGPRMPHGRMPGPMNPVCSLLKKLMDKIMMITYLAEKILFVYREVEISNACVH